jgi:hypothetical protein
MTREALKLLAVITVLAVQVCFASSSDESGMMNNSISALSIITLGLLADLIRKFGST